jgi:hypothetical protein
MWGRCAPDHPCRRALYPGRGADRPGSQGGRCHRFRDPGLCGLKRPGRERRWSRSCTASPCSSICRRF